MDGKGRRLLLIKVPHPNHINSDYQVKSSQIKDDILVESVRHTTCNSGLDPDISSLLDLATSLKPIETPQVTSPPAAK